MLAKRQPRAVQAHPAVHGGAGGNEQRDRGDERTDELGARDHVVAQAERDVGGDDDPNQVDDQEVARLQPASHSRDHCTVRQGGRSPVISKWRAVYGIGKANRQT